MGDLLSTLETPQTGNTALGDPGSLSLRTLADWFFGDCAARNLQPKTQAFYRERLTYLLDAAGDRSANSITTQHLRLITEHYRKERKWSVGSTNHFITCTKVLFSFLEQEEVLTMNPARRMEKVKGEQLIPDAFSESELKKLMAAAGKGTAAPRDTAMLLLLIDCGLRLGELVNLHVEDIDMQTGVIRVYGKGRKERQIPLSAPVRRALLKYLAFRQTNKKAEKNESYLWLSRDGSPLTEWGFITQLRRIGDRAKVENVHPHRFRHSFATQYLRNNGNPQHLQRILGHTTPTMTNRYVHLTDVDAKNDHQQASPATNLLGARWKASA